jgi:cullin 3
VSNESENFDETWSSLSASLSAIHQKQASHLSFEQLYRNAYKLVLKKQGGPLYEKVKEFEELWLTKKIQPKVVSVVGPSLLQSSATATSTTNANENRQAGERLLRALKSAWEDHRLCMNMTTDVLMYMVSSKYHGRVTLAGF